MLGSRSDVQSGGATNPGGAPHSFWVAPAGAPGPVPPLRSAEGGCVRSRLSATGQTPRRRASRCQEAFLGSQDHHPYLFFDGTASDAIAFYEKALEAKVVQVSRFSDTPGGNVPPEHANNVMHAHLETGGGTLFISDGRPGATHKREDGSLRLPAVRRPGRRRPALRRAGRRRHRRRAAAGHLLGRPLRPDRRPVRHPLDVQRHAHRVT